MFYKNSGIISTCFLNFLKSVFQECKANFLKFVSRPLKEGSALGMLTLLLMMGYQSSLRSQTVLVPGDIAFLGYNTDANGSEDHSFSWITLEDLSVGTVIYFTEEGWNANGNTWYAGNEGHYSWTATGATPAGTIIYVYENGSTDILISSVGSMSSLLRGTSWNLAGGDNLFAYQSTTGAKPNSPNFLSGLNGDDNFAHTTGCDAANNWFDCQNCTTAGQSCATTGTGTSGLPNALTDGTNAVALFPNPHNETDNAKYNGVLTGTKAFVSSEINNRNNWIYDDSNAFTITSAAYNTPNIVPEITNTPPTATAPLEPSVNEDDVNVALSNTMQVSDSDGDNQTLTFTVTGGTLTLGTVGITFGGSGNASASFTASGTLAAINAALDAATFTPTPNLIGDDAGTISFVSNDGTADSNTASVTFNITGVNDAPSFSGTIRRIGYTERGTPSRFNGGGNLAVTEPDGDALTEATIQFQRFFDDDALSILSPGPYEFTRNGSLFTLSGNGTSAEMRTALESIEFSNSGYDPTNGGVNGVRYAQIVVKDEFGNASNGLNLVIQILAINNDPTYTGIPSDISVIKNFPSEVDLSIATLEDIDSGLGNITVSLSVSAGSLTASNSQGVSVSSPSADVLFLEGSVGALDDFLNTPSNIRFTGEIDALLTLSANDGGNTGSGGGTSVSFGSVNINVENPSPVAIPPVAPLVEEDDENVPLSSDFSVTDLNGDDQMLTFTITGGTLSIGTTDITFSDGLNGSAYFTASGTYEAINNALSNATFTPTPNLFGEDAGVISFTANDGTSTSAEASVTFDIVGVNDDPTFEGILNSITVEEDEYPAYLRNALSSGIFEDIDAGLNNVSLTIAASQGAILIGNPTSYGVTQSGHNTSTLTLNGPAANIESFLNRDITVALVLPENQSGPNAITITLTANDNGNTGTGGGNDVVVGTVNVNITPVNDAPEAIIGTMPSINEDDTEVQLTGLMEVVDVDEDDQTVSISVVGGTVSLGAEGITFGGSGNGTTSFTASGSLSEINGSLASATFTPTPDLSGENAGSISFSANDGTVNSNVASVNFDIIAVNEEQTITFNEIPEKTYGDADFVLGEATTDLGLTVTFTAADPSIVEIVGNTATILKAGSTLITATQEGGEDADPAAEVQQTLVVKKKELTVTANDNQYKVFGTSDPVFTYSANGFVNEENESVLSGSLSREAGENVGEYEIEIGTLAGSNYSIVFTSALFTITPAKVGDITFED
ncbi:hypothetical protein SAMN04489724_0128, partial [Algoriphagus locisalis]